MTELDGVIVIVDNIKVAWFKDVDEAEAWASEKYFGKWLLKNYTITDKPLFTEEEMKLNFKNAEILSKKIKVGKICKD